MDSAHAREQCENEQCGRRAPAHAAAIVTLRRNQGDCGCGKEKQASPRAGALHTRDRWDQPQQLNNGRLYADMLSIP